MPDYYYRYCKKCEGKVVMHAFSEGNCTVCNKEVQTSHTPCDIVCRECSLDKDVCMSCGEFLQKSYGDITREDIKEAVEHVFSQERNKPKERVIKFAYYCKGVNGPKWTSSLSANLCYHPECYNCRNFEKAFKEEIEKWKDEALDPEFSKLVDDNFFDLLDSHEEILLDHIAINLVSDKEYKAKGTWQDILRYAENMGKEKQMLEALILQFFQELKKAKINWIREDHWKDTSVEDKVQEIITSYEKHFNITTERQGRV